MFSLSKYLLDRMLVSGNLVLGVLTKRFNKNRINKCEVEMGWRMYVLCLRLAVCAAFDHDKKALRNKSKGFII